MSAPSIPCTVQVLVSLKSPDPTAVTAAEAIRHLLGFGDSLEAIVRRDLHEMAVEGGGASLAETLLAYLDRTVVFWNPNKHRAWLRAFPPLAAVSAGDPPAPPDGGAAVAGAAGKAEGSFEAFPGRRARVSAFGSPPLTDPAWDHILVWRRESAGSPPDLTRGLSPHVLLAHGKGELFSLRWRSDSAEERRAWTGRVAVARSRREGLLVNPHFQDHRILHGPVPLPLWGGSV